MRPADVAHNTPPARSPAAAKAPRWAFGLLIVAFLALAILYNVATPVYEAPDEVQHAAFVLWLADGKGLPVVDPAQPGPWAQEGTQPPLYYWLAARVVQRLPRDEAPEAPKLNPYVGIGDPQRPDNKNRVVHDAVEEGWPYRGDALIVHVVRAFSTLLAVATLAAIYRLGRLVFPEQRGLALGMVGLVAFMPQFLFLSASVNNDNLVIAIASWVLVVLTGWLLRTPRLPGWPALAGLGLLLGLGTLAKYSGLLLWPLAGATLIWVAWRARRLRWLLPAGLLVLGLALAICGWWIVRNQQIYGDLSGLGVHLEIMGTRRRLPSPASAWREFRGFRISFWALFGWFNILVPDLFYRVMDGLAVLGIVGLGIYGLRAVRRKTRQNWAVLAMLAAWLVLVVAGIVRWTVMTPASQGRLLYPGLGAIALFLVLGWAQWIPRRFYRPVGVAALAGWGIWAALCPVLAILPAYRLPERVPSISDLDAAYSPLHVRYGDCCELVGYVPPAEPVHPGDRVPLVLIWQALEPAGEDYGLYVHAVGAEGRLLGQLDTYHGGGMYPTSQWRRGEVIRDQVYVPISGRAEGPALLRFNVGMSKSSDGVRLPALAPDGQELDVVCAGDAALSPSAWPPSPPNSEGDTVLDGRIRLAGAALPQEVVHAGQVVTVTLAWEALDRVTEDYVGFVHLVDPAGNDVGQDDHLPLDGAFPTRVWFPGMVVSDPYRLVLRGDLAPGIYELWAGMYRPDSGVRLEAVKKTGERWRDDLVRIGALRVTE